jgi:hypothetical protein
VQGSYEFVEGVLTTIPPAYFIGGRATQKLIRIVENYLENAGVEADLASEVEIVMSPARLSRADAALLTVEDQKHRAAVAKKAARLDPNRTRILVSPTLIIESVSPGHEAHDRHTGSLASPTTGSSTPTPARSSAIASPERNITSTHTGEKTRCCNRPLPPASRFPSTGSVNHPRAAESLL